ncbi:MAG: bis(5'-nucleosyl)-tetraphosphatase (symmetrical) YqeK [Clostridia bacterium]|nr:bis(5'-nucleosyl)-tetraphosphatase (symmetrical) YqeK [Clostridia bacterium]
MQKIGVLGGMMDPIHLGHMRAALAALNEGLDRVLLAPCLTPAHRPQPQASPEDRLAMCRLAAQADPRLEVSDIELRDTTCYAVDTVRLLMERYPGARITWILGADKLQSLPRWYQAETLFSLCDFLVCPRPGYESSLQAPGLRLRVMDIPPLEASSGDVLDRIHALDDAAELLPRDVARYIALHGLYQPDYVPVLRQYGMGDKRLRHTLGVRDTAVELAAIHGVSMQAAALAAMLHDLAKPLPLQRMQALTQEYGLALPREITADGNLLHGPLAAAMAERELGIRNEAVLSAIACHTTGKRGMTALDKVLFIADAIEPNRADYPGLTEMRRLAKTDLTAAVLLSMRRTKEYVLARQLHFCSVTEQAMQELLEQKEEKA